MKADISGSTPLAEQLDPEDLRRVLGTYFAALAREIHWHGGVVDKYIGDAVLAAFGLPDPQPDDAERAVRAGLAMQRAIERENETLHARYGVRLACRIGLATGEVGGYPPSDPESAMFSVFGETVQRAEWLEAAAPLGGVLVSAATRDAAPDAFGYDDAITVSPKGGGPRIEAYRVLSAARAGGGRAGVTDAKKSASLQVAGAREHVLAEERKIVTVLFADLSSDPPLSASLDQERVRDVLGTYFGVLAREIQRFGGTLDKYVGDAVMAVFGAPVSHEDDGARAIASALAIQAAASPLRDWVQATHGVKIAIRIGINTGEVVAGMLPGEVHAYTVTGDAVNTAQRIESAAAPGQVLISESTWALARHAFVVVPVPPLTLKGKKEPVPAFQVVGRERRATPRGGPALVGRRAELDRLYAAFREAGEGTGTLIHIHGEAGVGKSRIVGEFLSSLPRGTVRLRARASSYETGTAYALVADVVRRAFRIQAADPEPVAAAALRAGLEQFASGPVEAAAALLLEILGYGERSLLDPERKRRSLIALLRSLLERYSAAAPFVIVAEDTHWIDPASADVLSELAPGLRGLRCVLVTTSRDETGGPGGAVTMRIDPLSGAEAGALVDEIAGAQLDARTRALVLERTEGNPFFIEEVSRQLASGRTTEIPATIQDLLEARIDALDASPRNVAHRAAVIGRTFWTRVLERVTPDEALEPALRTLQEERFVVPREKIPERTFGFPHALVQEVVYGTQLLSQRRSAHGAVGEAIEDLFGERLEEFTDTLAFHYDRSDRDAKALEWLVRAGDRAKALFANEEALTAYRGALRRAADGEGALEAATILERIGDVALVAGRYEESIGAFRDARARAAAPRPATAARLLRKSALSLRSLGRFDDALLAIAGALAALGDTEDPEAGWLGLATGNVHFRRGDYAAARDAVEAALDVGERMDAQAIMAEALNLLGVISTLAGDPLEAEGLYRRSREIYSRLENVKAIANVRANLGNLYVRLGRYADALTEQTASLALRERIGDPWAIGSCHNNLGDVYRELDDPAAGLREYERALALWQPIGNEPGVALALVGRGAALLQLGRTAEARADLLEAEGRFAALRSVTYLPDLYRFLASVELADGDLGKARAAAARSTEHAEKAGARHQVAMTKRVGAEIALAEGDRTLARRLLDEARATLVELHEAGEVARVDATLERMSG